MSARGPDVDAFELAKDSERRALPEDELRHRHGALVPVRETTPVFEVPYLVLANREGSSIARRSHREAAARAARRCQDESRPILAGRKVPDSAATIDAP
jgi:hypothetical protein